MGDITAFAYALDRALWILQGLTWYYGGLRKQALLMWKVERKGDLEDLAWNKIEELRARCEPAQPERKGYSTGVIDTRDVILVYFGDVWRSFFMEFTDLYSIYLF